MNEATSLNRQDTTKKLGIEAGVLTVCKCFRRTVLDVSETLLQYDVKDMEGLR